MTKLSLNWPEVPSCKPGLTNTPSPAPQPKVARRTKFPIPIELIVVVIGTVASYLGDLEGNYDVQVIGNVTTG